MNRMNVQPTEWKKIFPNHISDKELLFKIYKELFYKLLLSLEIVNCI